MDIFGEENTASTATGICCDVCKQGTNIIKCDFKEELRILIDSLNHIGCKGEVKIAEWIRGSNVSWTNACNKNCLSYGNHRGKDMAFWRTFIKQCHVLSLVKLELRSMIKDSGLYAVNGVYHIIQSGVEAASGSEPFMLPSHNHGEVKTHTGAASYTHADSKRKRLGKGSNILTIARKLLSEPENWFSVENKDSYHFPGVLPKPSLQQLFYVPDISALNQSCDDAHFIWKDIQLSKGQLNKDRLIKVDIGDKCEEVYFRSAPCLGVKYCSSNDCSHVVRIRDKRNCTTFHFRKQLIVQ